MWLLRGVSSPARADGTTRPDADGSDPTGAVAVSPHAVPGDRFAGPITFSVIGDAPYGDAENAVFLQQLSDHNRYSRARFVAHVGDIFSSATPCTEDRYEQTAAWLRSLDVPVFIVPGDNEWVDCSDDAQAWEYWSTHLLGLEQSFCGVPAVQRQGIRPENFAFVMNGVLFLGVNVVAGSPTEAMLESADWVEEKLLSHRGVVRAAVVFSQAGPSPSREEFFDPFVLHAAAFGAPVLLVHGDGHSWQYESSYGVANLTRVQIERTTSPPVHITVTRDAGSPFLMERDPWPAGTPEFDDVPCVEAGASRTVAMGATTLFGAAHDDELAGPLVLAWSQRSGPGLASFGDPGAASTPVALDRLGTYVLQLEAFDGFYTQRDTLTVVAADPATVPLVQDDSGFVQEDNLLVVPFPGVLANDSHGGSLPLAAALLVPPANGRATLAPDGGYTYLPDLDWFGTDTFYYQASDPNGAIGIGLVTLQVLAVNDPPVAMPETYSTMVGQPLFVPAPGILGNDSDVDGDVLTLTLENDVANGTLSFGGDGSFSYTPGVDFIGADSFTYRVSDGMASSFASVTLSVSPIVLSSGPVADAYVRSSNPSSNYGSASFLRVEQDRTNYNSFLKFAVSGTGVSVRRARLRLYAIDGGPDGGEVHLVSNDYQGTSTPWLEDGITWANAPATTATPLASMGSVSNNSWVEWDVTAAVTGDGTYSFGIQNGSTNSVEYSSKEGSKPPELIVETDLPNTPPVAGNDSYTTAEDSVLAVPAPGVLANDSDDPRDVLSAVLLAGPVSGTLVFAADGSFTYTPAADFNGSVGFTYRVQDGRGGASTGNVTLVVEPVNDLPVAADDSYSTPEDSTLVVGPPGVLGNDADVDGQALAVSVQASPTRGTLALAADGSFTYTPAANAHGPDSFVYQVSDGAGGTDTATVKLNVVSVNDAPVAAADSFVVDEDGALEVGSPGVLANDTDADGEALRAALRRNTASGDLVLNMDGSFMYTPAADFHGTDSFDYAVQDGNGAGDSTTVTIRVRPVNDPPGAANESYTIAEDSVLVVAAPGLLENDTDADGDLLTAGVDTQPAAGSLVLAADGSFTYTPGPDFHGTDSFRYLASDGQGGSDTGTVNLTVTPVGDDPVAAADSFAVDEDGVLSVAAPGVLENDSDADGDALAAALTIPAVAGTVLLSVDGSFVYTPAANFRGSDSFTYEASDGQGGSATATVTIVVTAVNDSPAAANDSYSVREDSLLVVAAPGVLANDSDADGDSLQATLNSGPVNGALSLQSDGSFTYTPSPGYAGADSFTYTVVDGQGGGDTGSVALTVLAEADPPVATDDAYATDEDVALEVPAPGVLGNDTDADGDSLTAVLSSPTAQGTLVLGADGSFTYTPASDFSGSDAFTYSIDDGNGGSDVATVTLTVRAVNDAPIAVAEAYGTNEDVPLQVATPGVLGNDGDPDGDVLTAVVAAGPANGTLLLNGDGSFTYTPAPDYNGSDSFLYRVVDAGTGADSASVSLTVVAVNDAPRAAPDSLATDEDVPIVAGAPGVLGNDSDPDADPLGASLVTPPLHGTLSLKADGSFTYTPAADFHGTDALTYAAGDGKGGSDTTTVVLTITPVADPPEATADAYTIEMDSALVVASPGVLGNDTDADGDPLGAEVSVSPLHGSLNLAAAGGFAYTPAPAFAGVDSFAYDVSDGNGGSDTAWVRIDVGAGSPTAASGEPSAPVREEHVLEAEDEHAAAVADSLGAGPGDAHRSEAAAAADSAGTAGEGRDPAPPAPLGTAVLRARPNPFNGTVVIDYRLEEAGPVELWILDIRGQRVRRLVSAVQGSGLHQAVWNGRSDTGSAVASGVYFLRLRSAGRAFTSRLVLLE